MLRGLPAIIVMSSNALELKWVFGSAELKQPQNRRIEIAISTKR